jgi:uncharacterized membrane protein (UPF0127 family)
MIKNSLKLLLIVFISVSCFTCSRITKYNDGDIVKVTVNGKTLQLVAAVSKQAKAKGLSDRNKIPFDGMIFFFHQPYELVFWMKDMYFPIDIVFIVNNSVIKVAENAKPEPNVPEHDLTIYSPNQKADTVIELNAGRAKQLNIKNGSIIKLK